MSYDPVQRHLAIEKLVVREGSEGQEKKYYRVRPARWYGGIVTADCVGCGLLCKFCWVSEQGKVTLHFPFTFPFSQLTTLHNAFIEDLN